MYNAKRGCVSWEKNLISNRSKCTIYTPEIIHTIQYALSILPSDKPSLDDKTEAYIVKIIHPKQPRVAETDTGFFKFWLDLIF